MLKTNQQQQLTFLTWLTVTMKGPVLTRSFKLSSDEPFRIYMDDCLEIAGTVSNLCTRWNKT